MIKIAAILFMMMGVSGCSSVDGARQHFTEARDYDVGRNIKVINLPKASHIVAVGKDYSEYHYTFHNPEAEAECAWIYVVDRDTDEIVSWKYVTSSKACFNSVRLGTPW